MAPSWSPARPESTELATSESLVGCLTRCRDDCRCGPKTYPTSRGAGGSPPPSPASRAKFTCEIPGNLPPLAPSPEKTDNSGIAFGEGRQRPTPKKHLLFSLRASIAVRPFSLRSHLHWA